MRSKRTILVVVCLALAALGVYALKTKAGEFRYRSNSQHLRVQSDSEPLRTESIAETGELLLSAVNSLLPAGANEYPINVYLFSDKLSMTVFAHKRFGSQAKDALGICIPEQRSILLSSPSAETLAHELTHEVLEHRFADGQLEPWCHEGLPELFQTFYAYKDGDHYVLYMGLQNRGLMEGFDAGYRDLDLQDVVQGKTRIARTNLAQGLAAVFLYQRGKLPAYLRLVANHERHNFSSYYEAACDRRFDQLAGDWRAYLQQVNAELPNIRLYPESGIYTKKQIGEIAGTAGWDTTKMNARVIEADQCASKHSSQSQR